ncbi:MAG TPA: hypothetical protein PKC49_10235 [Phycisphaerae bacterium]|nr:hypothetical protein [Phycisphaerae bacterium]
MKAGTGKHGKRGRKAPRQGAKKRALLSKSERSDASRRKNILSGTAGARIKGHASGAQRAAQAKRDAKQRASKPSSKK